MIEDRKLRLFTALELPSLWRDELTRVQAELERVCPGALRWVRPDLMHLTLVFLGYQPPQLLPDIEDALRSASSDARPFSLSMGSPGCFGSPSSVRVVWVGLADTPSQLLRLHGALASGLSAHGIAFDRKPMVAHITLGRVKNPMDRAASQCFRATMGGLRRPKGLVMAAEEFVLMESQLSPGGPSYHVVRRFHLGARDG